MLVGTKGKRQAQPPERNSFWTPSLSRLGQELPQKVLSHRPLALSTALQDSSCSLALSVSLAKSFSHFCTSFFAMFVPGMSWKNVLACLGSKPKSSLESKHATKKPKVSMQERKEKLTCRQCPKNLVKSRIDSCVLPQLAVGALVQVLLQENNGTPELVLQAGVFGSLDLVSLLLALLEKPLLGLPSLRNGLLHSLPLDQDGLLDIFDGQPRRRSRQSKVSIL